MIGKYLDLIERLERADPLSKGDKGKAADAIIELRTALIAARNTMEDVVNGNYPNPRDHRPGQCQHGRYYYEDCEPCTDQFLSEAIDRIDEVLGGAS